MPYVITEKCLNEQYGQCVDVCPVDCIHPVEKDGKPFMVIDPDVCIECALCLPECPIGAIVSSASEAPEDARLDAELTPAAKEWEAAHGKILGRQPNEPPHRPENHLVH
jgi:ferredoxin